MLFVMADDYSSIAGNHLAGSFQNQPTSSFQNQPTSSSQNQPTTGSSSSSAPRKRGISALLQECDNVDVSGTTASKAEALGAIEMIAMSQALRFPYELTENDHAHVCRSYT